MLQEAQFACFENDEEGGASNSSLPSFVISSPLVRSQPPKSFARVRALECSGSGNFYFQNEKLRDRFVCWRVLKNVVLLREWSLNTTLKQNGLRLEFPAPVVATGVFAVESYGDDAVTINVVTHAGTIHRLTYTVPSLNDVSVFSQVDVKAFPVPRPATRSCCDVLQKLNADEILTTALWVNEYNLVLGTDAGRVLGVNFGLPTATINLQEFIFSDESVVSWLWHGLIRSTAAKLTGYTEDCERKEAGAAVIAMTCFQIDGEDDEDGHDKDVCMVTISADCMLRAWSFCSQSCLGRQQLRMLVTAPSNEDGEDNDETGWNDEDLDGDDGSSSMGFYATHAKVIALSSTESDNCRLLVHLDTTAAHSSKIFLLRGNVQLAAVSSAGSAGDELALESARVFTVQAPEQKMKRGLKLVDFAVDKNFLFSSWRSLEGDEVYVHPNPMALTGPKCILGQLVSSLDVQMKKYEIEDSEWLFELKEEGVMTRIDDFFAERILLPGRFSRQNLSNAIMETQNSALNVSSSHSSFAHRVSKYKEALVHLVSSRYVNTASADTICNESSRSMLRIRVWKELISLCTKYWRCENVPIGFATTTNALLPGAPVMLRRNRVSLLFPSASSITAAIVSPMKQGSTSGECVADLVSNVLPVFDAFASQSFQSFIHREVADVSSDWNVESFVALARHCVRLGLKPNSAASVAVPEQTVRTDLVLTRAILRLSKLIGGDATFQNRVFHDLVEHLFPFDLWRGPGAHKSSSLKCKSSDDDMDINTDKDDYMKADAAASSDYYTTSRRAFFAGHEMSFAFDQVASRTIDEMCNKSLRVVLFLAYLVDSRPAFVGSATLSRIMQVYLPKSITVYQRWRLSKWVANQGITQSIADTDPAIISSATLMPPLLQMFVMDVNKKLNGSENFKRALSILQLASATNNVHSEEAHDVLIAFTRDILQKVSQPNDSLVNFLQKRQQFRLLRALFCCNLSDISLHGSSHGEATNTQQSDQVHKYVRSIGECLACEGQEAAARSHDDANARGHARWCFHQAIRCFSICLSDFFVERNHRSLLSEKVLEQFIYDVVGLLKETVPRGFYDQLLSFLWSVVTQAQSRLAHHDGSEQSIAVQSFIWVNVFKYSVEERLFRDAHLALMHTLEHSATLGVSETAADAEGTASECVNYLVKELYRYGHLDLICELRWGSLESHVEKYLLWQAANATVVQSNGLDASAVRSYNLLFTFYMRKQQPANAASSLYALALRLRLAVSTSKAALEAQRNALNAACNTLRALPAENRWVVRKLHAEELKRSSLGAPQQSSLRPSLSVVTLEDIKRELTVLDGKLRLLTLGHLESLLLSTMEGDGVITLLLDEVHRNCHKPGNMTLAERRRENVCLIEIAAEIAERSSVASLSGLTKSLARYCVASEHPSVSTSVIRSVSNLLWELLEQLLANAGSLEQYEVAAVAVLDFWQQQGRKLALPAWLSERLASPMSGNPTMLLGLFLKHGLLLEGLQLVESLLPDAATIGGGCMKTISQMKFSLGPSRLPWIPYNLVDTLLDSTAAVLKQNVSDSVSPAAVAKLRERDRTLRHQLSQYFYLISAFQQAQEAANLACSSNHFEL